MVTKSQKAIAPHNPTNEERLEYFLEHFRANPKTGQLYWKIKYGGKELKGHINNGYLRLTMYIKNKKLYISKHRILFAIYHGRFPDEETDHINQDKLDNRMSNLRDATPSVNSANSYRKKKKGSKSKYYGVNWSEKNQAWIVKVYHNGKQRHIYYSKDEVECARKYNEYIIRFNIPNRNLNELPEA